jgi:hypothetical protein
LNEVGQTDASFRQSVWTVENGMWGYPHKSGRQDTVRTFSPIRRRAANKPSHYLPTSYGLGWLNRKQFARLNSSLIAVSESHRHSDLSQLSNLSVAQPTVWAQANTPERTVTPL